MVGQWNSDGRTVEQIWWNRATVIVEQRKSYGGIEEKRWLNSGTMMVEQSNRDTGTVQQ